MSDHGDRHLPFVKMHGAGNDFIMVDQRDVAIAVPGGVLGRDRIAALCDRRKGIGADGLIVIGPGTASGPATGTAFRMAYFNADGGEAEMCGNGARCSVAFAHGLGLAPDSCLFDTWSGELWGCVHGPGDVEISLPGWRGLDLAVGLADTPWALQAACNTGVPHLVIPVDDVDDVDIGLWGPRLRRHERFGHAGTNVNWVAPGAADGEWRIRTYERGVEAETLACGTGASASAVILCALGRARSPVALRTRGGDLLTVAVDARNTALRLRGPAVTAFEGHTRI
ncbi:MAG: diaminopimelate epimerase [bacterium]|nr:diaminopimelate epimerase [bacterium]